MNWELSQVLVANEIIQLIELNIPKQGSSKSN